MTIDPYLDDGMRAFLHNTARKNCWKIAGYDVEDLVQDGYMVYYRCWNRYVRDGMPWRRRDDAKKRTRLPKRNPSKEDRRRFMARVRMSFMNHITTLAWNNSARQELLITDLATPEQSTEAAWEAIMPTSPEQVTALALLMSAPTEIKQLMDLLISDAVDGYRRICSGRRKRRETNNERYCRLLNLPPETDLVGMVEAHFKG